MDADVMDSAGPMVNERRRRVLVVDDEEFNRMLLRHELEAAGYKVSEACSAAEAGERLKGGDIDIMLLDIGMPEVSGIDFLRQVRQNPETLHLPVILVSAFTDTQVVVSGLEVGAQDYVTKPVDFPVLVARIQNQLELTQRTIQLQEQADILSRLATLDPLTGVLNRRAFLDIYRTEHARAVRYQRPMAVMMLDLDEFKLVNDESGHPAGDEVLRQFADLAATMMRSSDHLCRYGGEEFCMLLTETELGGAMETAERIRKATAEKPFIVQGKGLRVTVSIGVSHLDPEGRESADSLIASADRALYSAKHGGRNLVCMAGG